MNILFLTIGEINDVEVRGIYTDQIRKFRDEGHRMYVVSPRERRNAQATALIEQNGITLLRVKTLNIQKTNLIEKGLATISIPYLFKSAIRKKLQEIKFDLVLYSTPPITFTNVIRYVKRKNHAVSYLLLKDIFPQNAVDINLFSKWNPIYWWFRKKEKALYHTSDYIGCMSKANVEYILKHNSFIPERRLEVNPNSIELTPKYSNISKNEIRKIYHLPEDVILFIYGGNLGKPQGIDFLLEVLEKNKYRKDCYFVIVGSGTEYKKIEQWFKENNPSNARLLSGLPKNEYDLLVSGCDVGLIFLDPRFTIPNYPSRLLSYMENKMPILAATDNNTDIGRIAEENNYGLWCQNGDMKAFNDCLEQLLDKDKITVMGENAYRYLQENYQVSSSYNIIMKHFD
jgi:glycosyltransferase involved in cell wall biosynthesis